jgi:SAM-dependent methyltransferase
VLARVSSTARVFLNQAKGAVRPLTFAKFNHDAPHPQAAVDLFKDHWACPPDVSSGVALVRDDPRVHYALRALSPDAQSFAGARVLELGPNDGVHTPLLEKMGAEVVCIDANAEAYMKMLVVKELYGLRAKIMFGDFFDYLPTVAPGAFDLIFASGVLYHMTEPLELIRRICSAVPRSFIMTHYYAGQASSMPFAKIMKDNGYAPVPHYRRRYGSRSYAKFWGGLEDHQCWLERDEILRAFRTYGHEHIDVLDDSSHPEGPVLSFVTSRTPL